MCLESKPLLVQVDVLHWPRTEELGAPIRVMGDLGLAHLLTYLGHERLVELRSKGDAEFILGALALAVHIIEYVEKR